MEIQEYVSTKKKIYESLIEIIESEEENDYLDEFQFFYDQFDDLQIQSNHDEMKELLELISIISLNHHRNNRFISKITKIISHYSDQINQNFSNIEIFNYFKKDKLLLLTLFELKIINIDKDLYHLMIGKSDTIESEKEKEARLRLRYDLYFYPEFRAFMNIKEKTAYNKQINNEGMTLKEFREKRKTGENDGYLCEIIRNDSVESFITYINQKNYSLESKITSSIFETNFFLIENETNLIEYAAFFGSFQIFQYLLMNNVELRPSIWFYVIRGKNADLIHLLEEHAVKMPNESYSIVLKESMKCHHNDISNYFKNNFFNEDDQIYNANDNIKENILSYSFHYHNYSFISDLLDLKYAFCYMCKYNYIKLVELFLKYKKKDINNQIIHNQIFFNQIYIYMNLMTFLNFYL